MTSGSKSKQNHSLEGMTRQEKVNSFSQKHEKAQRRKKQLLFGGLGFLVVILVTAVIAVVQVTRVAGGGGGLIPPVGYNAQAQLEVTKNSIIVGDKDAPHTFTVYEDPLCPFCGIFEEASHDEFSTMIDNKEAKVEYVTVAFLNNASSDGRYSSRAGSLLAAVAQYQPAKWYDLHEEIFISQPEEGSTLTDAQLLDVAKDAEVEITPEITNSVKNVAYRQWIEDATEQASKDKITGTPTIQLDGEVVQVRTGQDVRNALDNVNQ